MYHHHLLHSGIIPGHPPLPNGVLFVLREGEDGRQQVLEMMLSQQQEEDWMGGTNSSSSSSSSLSPSAELDHVNRGGGVNGHQRERREEGIAMV